jgi:hypothetical protein
VEETIGIPDGGEHRPKFGVKCLEASPYGCRALNPVQSHKSLRQIVVGSLMTFMNSIGGEGVK